MWLHAWYSPRHQMATQQLPSCTSARACMGLEHAACILARRQARRQSCSLRGARLFLTGGQGLLPPECRLPAMPAATRSGMRTQRRHYARPADVLGESTQVQYAIATSNEHASKWRAVLLGSVNRRGAAAKPSSRTVWRRTFFSRACSGVSWLMGVSMMVPPVLYAGVAPKPGVAPTAGVAPPAMGPAGVSSHLQRSQ